MDISEENNNNKVNKNIEKKRTSGNFKNEIIILMDLYNFNNELKNNINKLTISKEDSTSKKFYIYLIREDYFSNFTEIFLYKEVHETIKNGQIDPEKGKGALLNSLSKIYQEIYLENINNYKGIVSLDNENIYKIEYTLNNTKTEMIFIYQYAILNHEIIDIIYKEKSKQNLFKFSHIINSKKIIIKYEPKKSILIGTINEDDIKNIFIPEIILEYNDITQMQNHFNFLEQNEFEKSKLHLKEKISELKDEENNIIGKIYLIDKNKYNNLSKYNENILLSLYNNYEIINKKMQNPFEKEESNVKYYIINNNYIKKLKELFKYEDILPKLNQKIPFNEIIIQENYLLDRNIIMNELSKDELFKIKKAEFKIDENNVINYLTEFDIISKELKEYLEEYNLIQINQELIEIELIPGNNKIIIHSFNLNKNIAIILSQNYKNEFISEIIFVFNDSMKLINYLNKIIEKGFDNVIQELNFTNKKSQISEDKKEVCGNAYEIIPLIKKQEIKIKEEILNMIHLYLFNRDINDKIKNIINKEKYEEYKGYLVNKDFIDKYKGYYLYNNIKKYLDNLDNVNNTEENIKIIYEKMKQEEFFKNYINKDVLLLKDINIEQIKINKKEISLNEKKYFYFDEFIIVNEDIYNKILKENIILNNDKIEYIINSGKIFLFITSEDIYQVLIVEIKNNNNKFYVNSFIVFNSMNELNAFKSSLTKMDFHFLTKNLLKNKENKLFTKEKKEIGIFFNIDKNSDIFNDIEVLIFNENKIIFDDSYMGDKMIKIFLFLYLFQDEINQSLRKSIKENGNRIYYLVNKKWMKIYKEYYDYNKLCSYFDNMKKSELFSYIYHQLIESLSNKNEEKANEFIYQLIKDIPNDILKKLENLKKNQVDLIKKLTSKLSGISKIKYQIKNHSNGKVYNIKYNDENELINVNLFNLIINLENPNIIQSLASDSEKIECLIGENKLYIKSKSLDKNNSEIYYLNIGYIKNNIFSTSLLIFYYEKHNFDKFISYLNTNLFSEFIGEYNLIECPCYDIKSYDNKNIGRINKIGDLSEELKFIIENNNVTINEEQMKILKLILYIKIFDKLSESPIKDNLAKKGFLIKKDFIETIQKFDLYNKIDYYIEKKNNIQEIINNNIDEEINNLSKLVEKGFGSKIIKEFNVEKINININITSFNVSLDKISLNNNNTYISYANNFILFDEDIYNLFKGWSWTENYSSNYLYVEKKILLISDSQKIILVYDIKDKIELELKMILQYDKDKNIILDLIKEKGFNEFVNFFLFNINDFVSPIFDKNQNKIGIAYRFPAPKNGYVDYNLYFKIRKMFVLYLNYKKLNSVNNKSFEQYYLVNKNWIQNYKTYYDFNTIYNKIEENYNNIINSIKENEWGDKFISDKKLALILADFPKDLLNKFIEKDNFFEKKYQNAESKVPEIFPLNYFDESQPSHAFFYFDNFEIINSKIYKYLFEKIDNDINIDKSFMSFKQDVKNGEENVFCLFDKNRVIIKTFNNMNLDDKPVLYIGKINPIFTFEIECFLIYDNAHLMNEYIQIINNSIGFNDFCEEFMNIEINIKELKINKIKYGIAVKKNQNPDLNFNYNDNDLISKHFEFTPKVRLNNIEAPFYLNSVLQCFCQIEEFASYFKYNSHVKKIINDYRIANNLCLSSSFKKLIDNIWPNEAMRIDSDRRNFTPTEFIKEISNINPFFRNNQNTNAKDFINFIIMDLHKELNEIKENNNINNINNFLYNNNNDMKKVFNIFYEDYKRKYNSKISELFYAFQRTEIKCLNCHFNNYSYEVYYYLVFSLEEVKNFAINKINSKNSALFNNNMNNNNFFNNNFNNMNNNNCMNFNNNMINQLNMNPNINYNNMNNINNSFNNINNNGYGMGMPIQNNFNFVPSNNVFNPMNNNNQNNNNMNNMIKLEKLNKNIVSIYDCFDYYNKISLLQGSEQIYCIYCKQMAYAEYGFFLETTAKILILFFEKGTKFLSKIKLDYSTEIDIGQYVNQNNKCNKYKLIGIVMYQDENGVNNIYTAHCLSPIDAQWYTYNDDNVRKVDDFQKEVIDNGTPCLLFYKRIE